LVIGARAAARHPLADVLLSLEYPTAQTTPSEPMLPVAMEQCPLTLVDTPQALTHMAATLAAVDQIAVDLEHHHYRSFMGFTCLMQVSTRRSNNAPTD